MEVPTETLLLWKSHGSTMEVPMEVLRFRPPHGSTVEAQWKHSESPTEAPKEALMSFHGSTTEAS